MREKLPTIGLYILPQPDNTTEYVSIPNIKNSKVAPFGYKLNEEDNYIFDPIAEELNALEEAKKYLKQYSSRKVAAWLTNVTGRSITHTGLLKRIKHEGTNKRKAQIFRQWARRLENALEFAKKYEKTTGYKEEKKLEAQVNGARSIC